MEVALLAPVAHHSDFADTAAIEVAGRVEEHAQRAVPSSYAFFCERRGSSVCEGVKRAAVQRKRSDKRSDKRGSPIGKLMFFQPVARDLLNRLFAIAIPSIQQSKPFDGAPEVAKSPGAVNGVEQHFPGMLTLLL